MERPARLDPDDLAGTEGITAEDTGEADFGRLLERAHEKNYAGGMASPTGVVPEWTRSMLGSVRAVGSGRAA